MNAHVCIHKANGCETRPINCLGNTWSNGPLGNLQKTLIASVIGSSCSPDGDNRAPSLVESPPANTRLVFIEELAVMIGKSVTTIRTCSSNQKYHHLIPRPRKLPNSRRLCWTLADVLSWIESSRPAEPPPLRRPRGRPTKAEQLARARWMSDQPSVSRREEG